MVRESHCLGLSVSSSERVPFVSSSNHRITLCILSVVSTTSSRSFSIKQFQQLGSYQEHLQDKPQQCIRHRL